MNCLTPAEDDESRTIIESVGPKSVQRSVRIRPRSDRPRRIPLNQHGWNAYAKKKQKYIRRKEDQPDHNVMQDQEENINYDFSEALDNILGNEEEEEEEENENGLSREMLDNIKRISSFYDCCVEFEDKNGKKYQENRRFVGFDIDDEEEDSDSNFEHEGIDYPDGECIDEDQDFDDELDNY